MRTKPTENVTTGALARILVLTALVMAGTAGRAAAVEPDFDNVAAEVCKNLEYLGIKLDKLKNENRENVISDNSSKVKVYRIPTNEELVIAMDTSKIVGEPVQ